MAMYQIGDLVEIRTFQRNGRPLALGRVLKVTATQIQVCDHETGQDIGRYRIDPYLSTADAIRHVGQRYRYSTAEPLQDTEESFLENLHHEREQIAVEKAEKEREQQRAEEDRQKAIASWWTETGKALWEGAQQVTFGVGSASVSARVLLREHKDSVGLERTLYIAVLGESPYGYSYQKYGLSVVGFRLDGDKGGVSGSFSDTSYGDTLAEALYYLCR